MEEQLQTIIELLQKNITEKATISIQEAALYSGIGHEKLRELISSGKSDLPYFKVGQRVSINKKAFDEWLNKIAEEHRAI